MGLDVGGFTQKPDWPKLGPSLVIAASLILAIRTAKWAVRASGTESQPELEREIEHAVYLAGCVLSALVMNKPGLFPQAKAPWYMANDEDVPK